MTETLRTPKILTRELVSLPLGVSMLRYGQHPEDRADELMKLHRILGECSSIHFSVKRSSKEAYSVDIKKCRVPSAQGGRVDVEQSFAGLIGDTFELGYGQRATIVSFTDGKLIVCFTKVERGSGYHKLKVHEEA